MKTICFYACFAMIIFWASPVFSQDMYVFPNKGQSQETMEKDKYQCYQWAKQQTGFDPSQPQYTTQVNTQRQGDVVRGAARGALVGAVAQATRRTGVVVRVLVTGRAAALVDARAGNTPVGTHYRRVAKHAVTGERACDRQDGAGCLVHGATLAPCRSGHRGFSDSRAAGLLGLDEALL